MIKNNTSEVKELKVQELVSGRMYSIYLEPHGETELEKLVILNPEDFVEVQATKIAVEKESAEPLPEDPSEYVEESKEPVLAPDKFVCDICSAEFASARGLSAHMNKSHK